MENVTWRTQWENERSITVELEQFEKGSHPPSRGWAYSIFPSAYVTCNINLNNNQMVSLHGYLPLHCPCGVHRACKGLLICFLIVWSKSVGVGCVCFSLHTCWTSTLWALNTGFSFYKLPVFKKLEQKTTTYFILRAKCENSCFFMM